MLIFLQKRWFLVALVSLISTGLIVGTQMPATSVESLTGIIPAQWVTAWVLLLMAFSLDSKKLKESFHSPGPVVWAASVNFGLIPVMGYLLMRAQASPDFSVGLMIAASVPCTLAAASVWTRKAKGNDAVSLLVTLVTNTLCFVVTPFWLNLATSQTVELELGHMVQRLTYVVLLPTIAGQVLRQIPALGRLAVRQKTPIGVIAQACILVLVFSAATEAGLRLSSEGQGPTAVAVATVAASCVALHLIAMLVGVTGARVFGFAAADRAAIAFASSQKTLPIGIYLASEFSAQGLPFAVFPIIIYHASQLFIDTVVADRLAARIEPAVV